MIKKPEVISIGSGKGGTGKSFFSFLLAKTIAEKGKKVLLFDGDLGCANLHTLCGLKRPERTLSHFISNKYALEEIAIKTPVENLSLISGASDSLTINALSYTQKRKLLLHLNSLPFDVVIIDVGPDISQNNLDLYSASDHKFLVLNPERVSLENCYRFLKAVLLRKFSNAVGIKKSRGLFQEQLTSPFSAVNEMHSFISENKKDMLPEFRKVFNETEFFLVVNKVYRERASVADAFKEIVEKYLTTNLNYLGDIPFDMKVMECYSDGVSPDSIEEINKRVDSIYTNFSNII